MIKSILIPIDGSPAAEEALSLACSFAGLTGASLFGLYVEDQRRFEHLTTAAALAAGAGIEPIVPTPLAPEEMVATEEQVESEGEALETLFRQKCADAEIDGDFFTARGIPADVLVEAAKSVDFVILGNAGKHTGVESIASGATVELLLRQTTRPVLVVPREVRGESSIVVGYDGSAGSERVLRFVAELAELTQLDEVHVLSVGSDAEALAKLQQSAITYLQSYDVDLVTVTRSGKPQDELLQYADSVGASIVAIGAFGSNMLSEIVFGSTTRHIFENSNTGVLLMG